MPSTPVSPSPPAPEHRTAGRPRPANDSRPQRERDRGAYGRPRSDHSAYGRPRSGHGAYGRPRSGHGAYGRQWQVFYGIMRWSFVLVMILLPVCLGAVIDLPVNAFRGEVGRSGAPSTAAFIGMGVVVAATVLAALAVDTALTSWAEEGPASGRGRWDLPRVGVIRRRYWPLVACSLPLAAAVPLAVGSDAGRDVLLMALCAGIVALCIRVPWWWGLLGAAATVLLGAALGLPLSDAGPAAAIQLGFSASLRASLWVLAMVREMEDLRTSQARLAVAEERLRFARDLHDVTGRDLSAIGVKAELTARLAERGDPRTAAEARDVAHMARTSLAEIRALVRGYRDVDLATELRGTASLLRSAGIDVHISGDASDLDPHAQVRAAWALREAGTNILRHADATSVRISLAPHGIVVENDGVDRARSAVARAEEAIRSSATAPAAGSQVEFGSGLSGLAERIGHDGHVHAASGDGVFRLDVGFNRNEESS